MKVFQGVVKTPQQDVNSSKPSYVSNWRTNYSAPKSDFTTFSYNKPNRITFKGLVNNFINPDDNVQEFKLTEFKELTNAEFKTKKNKIKKNINNAPENVKEKLKDIDLSKINKYNIFVLEATLNNPQLFKYQNFTNNIKNVVSWTNTTSKAKTQIDLMNKIGQHPEVLEKENFTNNIGDIIRWTKSPEKEQVVSQMIDTPQIFESKNFTDNLRDIICNADTPEKAEVVSEMIKYPQLFESKNITDKIADIIGVSESTRSAKAKIDVIDKIGQHSELLKYQNFSDNLGDIICWSNTPEQAKAKIDLMDKVEEKPQLLENQNFTYNIGEIISNTKTKEEAQIKLKFIDEYSDSEKAKNSLGGIISTVDSQEQYEFVTKYVNGDKSPIYVALDHALKNKDQLKSGVEDISDGEILGSFIENHKKIETTINTVGLGTFEASYPLKLDGVEDYAEDIANLSESLSPENHEALMKKINPTNSTEYKETTIKLQNEITELKKQFPQAKAQGGEILQSHIKDINTKSRELKDFQSQQKTTMTPQEIVSKTRALSGVNKGIEVYCDLNKDEIIPRFIDVIDDNKQWTEVVNKTVYNKFGIDDYKNLSEKLKLDKSEYLGEMLSANKDFDDNFKILLKQLQGNPNLSIKDALEKMPQNQETKNIYQEMGINYDNYVNIDKNSYIPITVKLNAEEAKQNAIKNMEEDFNDPAFNELPKEECDKLTNRLKQGGYTFTEKEEPIYDEDGFTQGVKKVKHLYKNNKPIVFEDLKNINSVIKEELNSNSFWTTKLENEQLNSTKETLYNHLMKLRPNDYENAKSIKDEEIANLEVRKVDMNDVSHSLFLGNHGACCTAIGTGINQISAPTYVMNKCIGAIEVADLSNKNNSFAGNTMCYIAKVDEKPALVLDNIELSQRYQGNDQIRDAIIKYAKQFRHEIATQPDGKVNEDVDKMPIYAGPYRHKVDLNNKEFKKHDLQISGSTGDQKVYIDYTTRPNYVIDNKRTDEVNLYKLSE